MSKSHTLGNKIDALLSFSIAHFVFAIVLFVIDDAITIRGWASLYCYYALIAWALIADGWFMIRMWMGMIKGWLPLAPLIAVSQPRLPRPFRPFVAIWWLLHAILIAWFIIMFLHRLENTGWLHIALMFLSDWATSYLSFIFFLLTFTAFSGNLDVVLRFWKRRAVWSLVFSIVMLTIEFCYSFE